MKLYTKIRGVLCSWSTNMTDPALAIDMLRSQLQSGRNTGMPPLKAQGAIFAVIQGGKK